MAHRRPGQSPLAPIREKVVGRWPVRPDRSRPSHSVFGPGRPVLWLWPAASVPGGRECGYKRRFGHSASHDRDRLGSRRSPFLPIIALRDEYRGRARHEFHCLFARPTTAHPTDVYVAAALFAIGGYWQPDASHYTRADRRSRCNFPFFSNHHGNYQLSQKLVDKSPQLLESPATFYPSATLQ